MLGRACGRGRGGRGRPGDAGDRRGAAGGVGGGRRRRGDDRHGRARHRRHRTAAGGGGGAVGVRRVHRADEPVAQSHERTQARHRQWCSRRDDAGRHRGHARARDVGRLRHDGGAVEGGGGGARSRDAGASDVPPRDRPRAVARRPGRDLRRRRADRERRVREPAVWRGVHRAGVRGGHGGDREPRAVRDKRGAGDADRSRGTASSRPTVASGRGSSSCCSRRASWGRISRSSGSGRTTWRV